MHFKLLFILSCLLISTFSYSQIKIGDNPQNISAASVLELESTSRAFVLTRVNTTQMNAITPLQGALIYNTDSQCVHYYDGAQWLNLCDALTNSGNISLVDNGDGTYTFSDANSTITQINNLNESLEVEDGNLILTDSAGNSISVELQNLNSQTFSTDAIINTFPTIFITQDASGTNFNFEVGIIDGENIQDGSIKQADLAGSSVGSAQLRDNSVRNVAMADNSVGSPEIINGSVQPIDIGPGSNNQILTTNDAGAVQWTDQAGLVSADEVSYDNATSSLSATNVQDALDEVNVANTTINLLDNGDGTYTFTKSDGTTVTIEDTSISTLTDNGNGTYTYTDETGTTQTINTNGFTITNLISGNRIATITKPDGTTNNINETITSVTGTAATGKLIATYNNENGTAVVINETVTNISDTNDGFITYTNENGTVQKVNKSNVIDNGNGTYSFTNNDGSDVTIDTRAISNPYTPSSGLTSTNVQGAIDELAISTSADNDADPTNELSDVALSGTTINLTNPSAGATGVDLDLTFATDAELAAVQADVDANETAANNAISTLQADVDQNETDADTAISLKEDAANKSDNTTLGNSAILFPTQNAVKTYVDTQVATITTDDDITDVNFDGTDLTVEEGTTSFSADLSALEESADIAAVQADVDANETAANNAISTLQADVDQNETDADTAISLKEDAANKSDNTTLGNSAILFPTQNAVKTYVDTQVATITTDDDITDVNFDGTDLTVEEGTTSFSADLSALEESADIAVVQADVDANETAANNAISTLQADVDQNEADADTAISLKEDAANKSDNTTLGNSAILFPTQNAVKTYVDTQVATITTDDDITDVNFDGTDLTVEEGTTSFSADLSALEESSDIAAVQSDVDANETAANNAISTLQADVDQNEADADTAIALKENAANKSIDDTFATADNVNFPTQLAVKTYVDGQVAASNQTIVSTDPNNVISAGADGGAFYDDATIQSNIATNSANISSNDTDIANNATAIATKENSANKSIDDTFATADNVNFPTQLAVKTYVDGQVAASNQTIVSTDANNVITAGADGGAFYDDATIQANIAANSVDISSNDTDIANNTAAIATKEDSANKSDNTALGNSATLFPTQNAVKTYVDNEITASNQTIVSTDANNVIAAGADGGAFYDDATIQANIATNTADISSNDTDIANNATAIATKENSANKSIDDTFATADNVNFPTQLAVKTYVDGQVAASNQTIVSTDANNVISAGADGGAFYDDATIQSNIATNSVDISSNDTDIANNATAIATKENSANKSIDDTFATADNVNFPTQLAVKTYVDGQVAASNQTIVSTDANNVISAGADGGAFYDDATIQANIAANSVDISSNDTDIANNTAAIATKEDSANKSDNTALGNSATLFPTQNAVKTYVDNEITASNQTIVSTDANNVIAAGADGGAFYDDATIQANIAANSVDISSNDTDIANNSAAIATKEDAANKSIDDTFATADNVNFPTQLAVKTYVDGQVAASNTLASANIFVGDALNTAQEVNLNGDATLDNTGLLTISNNAVTTAKIADNNITTAKILDANVTLGKLADGTAAGQLMQWNGTNWVLVDETTLSSTETNTTLTQDTSTGIATYIGEDATPQSINIISTDSGNSISAGSDGGAYFSNPAKVYGKYDASVNTVIVPVSADISGFSRPFDGRYILTFGTARSSSDYIIQLTLFNSIPTESIDIFVSDQTASSFTVDIVRDGNGDVNSFVAKSFYFTVIDF